MLVFPHQRRRGPFSLRRSDGTGGGGGGEDSRKRGGGRGQGRNRPISSVRDSGDPPFSVLGGFFFFFTETSSPLVFECLKDKIRLVPLRICFDFYYTVSANLTKTSYLLGKDSLEDLGKWKSASPETGNRLLMSRSTSA